MHKFVSVESYGVENVSLKVSINMRLFMSALCAHEVLLCVVVRFSWASESFCVPLQSIKILLKCVAYAIAVSSF